MKFVWLPAVVLLTACVSDESSLPSLSRSTGSDTVQTTINDDSCVISADQQAMLDAVNQVRVRATECGNELMPAVSTLSWNCSLAAAALGHSQDMSRYGFLDHVGSDGLSLGDRMTAQGYSAVAWAENIAEGYDSVSDVVSGWLGSEGHCANIMNPNVDEMGAAASRSSSGVSYWTQVFAAESRF